MRHARARDRLRHGHGGLPFQIVGLALGQGVPPKGVGRTSDSVNQNPYTPMDFRRWLQKSNLGNLQNGARTCRAKCDVACTSTSCPITAPSRHPAVRKHPGGGQARQEAHHRQPLGLLAGAGGGDPARAQGRAAGACGRHLECIRSLLHGHVEAVRTAMRRLGFARLIDGKASRQRELVMAMVAGRVIAPEASKLAMTRALGQIRR